MGMMSYPWFNYHLYIATVFGVFSFKYYRVLQKGSAVSKSPATTITGTPALATASALSTDGKASKNSVLQTQVLPVADIFGKTTMATLSSYRKWCLSYPFHRVLLSDEIESLYSFISSISILPIHSASNIVICF
jgi:hypothetical protein